MSSAPSLIRYYRVLIGPFCGFGPSESSLQGVSAFLDLLGGVSSLVGDVLWGRNGQKYIGRRRTATQIVKVSGKAFHAGVVWHKSAELDTELVQSPESFAVGTTVVIYLGIGLNSL